MSISKPVKVPPQFAEDFDLVADHYRLRELGEYETAKEIARSDLANAVVAFASIARQINPGRRQFIEGNSIMYFGGKQ